MSPERLGATPLGDGSCAFAVWAPDVPRVELRLPGAADRLVSLERDERGYHRATVPGTGPGTLYLYRLERRKDERPDPASRAQPRGVHGPSAVVDLSFPWTDGAWKGLELPATVLYELHVGTFTPEGTFDAVVPRLDSLRELGVTAVELMPVAQFPGRRNWGYDGVYPFAVQDSYGGPAGLKRLVDACHARGMALVLDVVYNHLGPEGNYLAEFGPYFTDRYRTPWGRAINFDGPGSDEVRRYFVENALEWVGDFHVDGLRLDALHAIVDPSARPFLRELSQAVHAEAARLGRRVHLFAEVDRNDPRFVQAAEAGGLGMDSQWNDDFHHVLRVLLTGEREGYYRDYGEVAQLARAFVEGYVYSGQPSVYRGRRHGAPLKDPRVPLVVFAQNHDQVGNRLRGERLSELTDFEGLKLAAGTVILSPFIPLLFMGEEHGERAPFLFFADHSDPGLVEAVRRGRREEFAAFGWTEEPPDPFDEGTFRRCRVDPAGGESGRGKTLRSFTRELLRLRRELPALAELDRGRVAAAAYEAEKVLLVHRWSGPSETLALFHFGGEPASITLPPRGISWRRILDSSEERWGGPGSALPELLDLERGATAALAPRSFALFENARPQAEPELLRAAAAELPAAPEEAVGKAAGRG